MPELPTLRSASARRFDAVLVARGLTGRVVELPESTRTAAEAAKAVGCELRQIVKSLVFRGRDSGNPVLILVSGANRVDEPWMAGYLGEHLERAHPEFARSATGYAIGGVPPAGHVAPIPTYIDYDLLELREVWAAAGHPNAVCRLTSGELLDLTHGRPVPVTPTAGADGGADRPWFTFDCYGTLVDWKEGFLTAVRNIGVAESRPEGERLFHEYLAAEPTVESGPYRPYREVMAETLVRAVRANGGHLATERAEELSDSVPEWPLFPDVAEALAGLKSRGLRLGILSNIDREMLRRTLAHHGIPADFVVTAEDVHSYKPAPPHWIRFLKENRTRPGEVTHVSSSCEYDLATAGALGFRTVHVARYGPLPAGGKVDGAVSSLPALLDLRTGSTGPPSPTPS